MTENYDVLIVGSGAAGLYCALHLDPRLKVLQICKKELKLSNSSLAQGGIAAVVDTAHDSIRSHFQDTMIAGGFKNNPDSLGLLVKQGPEDVRRLMDYGVEFDRREDGSLHLTLEGGHSRPRILHHKDATGREIVNRLIEAVRKLPGVEVAEHAMLTKMEKTPGGFCADVLQNGRHRRVTANFCVLATGGIGRIYEYTTNSAIATGDGITLASELGAAMKNISYIQFHPTAFAADEGRERFLISEAVRGEGAILLNCNHEQYMARYDERGDLAPRDVVSQSTIRESVRTGSNRFYLDISHKPASFIRQRFPMIYKGLLAEGYDLTQDKIPVFPCQHYLMGGINVDLNARTSVDGLYAAGECSHTGVHGQNRLASNSLLEAVVFSRRAAEDINRRAEQGLRPAEACALAVRTEGEELPAGLRTQLRSIMQHAYFVIPNMDAIEEGLRRAREIRDLIENGPFQCTPDFVEAKSLATIACLILEEVVNR